MALKRIQVGERMSQAVIHGNTVYTAGQVALGAPGESAPCSSLTGGPGSYSAAASSGGSMTPVCSVMMP